MTLSSRRGAIVDTKGRELGLSTKAYSVYADPKIIEGKKKVSRQLGKILDQSSEGVFKKIKNQQKRFVWIQRRIDKKQADQIKELNVRGLQIVEEFKRVYPNENLMASVLGFVGKEGQGLEGLELKYNQALEGDKKKVVVRRDARGRPLVADGLMFAENPDGAELKLTVDADLQYFLETELKQAVEEFEAESAMAVVLDAKTSAVLAMGNAPTFDLNEAFKFKSNERRNRIVTDVFEPGSTIKTFVIAAALREKIIQPNTKYNTEGGRFQVGDRIIKEAEAKEKWQQLSVSEILAFSSNVGATKIAFDLGALQYEKALKDFGFGQKTGIDLPGDSKGLMHPLPWRPHLLANISFGHGMATTALQVANAYAVIANGGVLRTPYIVQSMRDPETGKTKEFTGKEVRRVLSTEDAARLRLMLTGVTAPGAGGVNAKVDGFLVAGKTGTAQKVDPNGRGYLKGGYISSFAGFIPAHDPKFVIYVVVDHPKKKNTYYGAQVAAPLFSRVASYAVRHSGLAPVLLSEKNLVNQNFARSTPKKKKDKTVVEPEPISEILANSDETEIVPDLSNLTLREVYRRLSGRNIELRWRGEGVVAEMFPPAGSALPNSRKIQVLFKPLPETGSIE